MSIVEEAYRAAIDSMTPAERIERMVNLTASVNGIVAHQITREEGPMSPEMLKWKLALRIHGKNRQSRQLIERMLANVAD